MAKGTTIGEDNMGLLAKALVETGRTDEIVRAADDPAYRATLFEEFAIR